MAFPTEIEMAERTLEISLDSFKKNAEYRGIFGVISYDELMQGINYRNIDPVIEIVQNRNFVLKYHMELDEAYLQVIEDQEVNDTFMNQVQFLHLDRNYITRNIKALVNAE